MKPATQAITLNPDVYRAIEQLARANCVSTQEVLREAVNGLLARCDKCDIGIDYKRFTVVVDADVWKAAETAAQQGDIGPANVLCALLTQGRVLTVVETKGSSDPRIISYADAKAAGLDRYFTGVPCSRGHIGERRVSSRTCVECSNEYQRDRIKRYPELVRTQLKAARARRAATVR